MLDYTLIVGGSYVETTVKWKLEATKLTLKHSNISNYPGATAISMFESFNGGRDNCISGFASYLKEEVNAG
ncbi:hypothetical protein [Gelatiniphilus marinus]|uniref:Uncharacterized protein n=1 Tax=Gelatiniphilus marinus TaxID=1759464 RepID=A0ABW5JRA1_9FLAO